MNIADGDSATPDRRLLSVARAIFATNAPKRVGVAVSGGSDSMAALHLLAQAFPDVSIYVVTVDHGLRSEAATEAKFVGETCEKLGFPHEVLRWEHDAIQGNLPDQARQARYALISSWANRNEVGTVVLGHTADDQAETVLMGLARSAGVDGLAGMRAAFEHEQVRFIRPFLSVSRSDLRDFLRRKDLVWVDDPSNEDLRFDRVKARKILSSLSSLKVDLGKLSVVAENMALTKQALDHYSQLEAERLISFQNGDILLTRNPSPPIPAEIERRLLNSALQWVSGSYYRPRQSSVRQLEIAFRTASTFTLAGCVLSKEPSDCTDDEKIRITRELNAVADVEVPSNHLWDGRWRLDGPHACNLSIRALGKDGLLSCPNWRESGMPRNSLVSSPAIWDGNELLSAPIARNFNGWAAKLDKSRDEFAVNLIRR